MKKFLLSIVLITFVVAARTQTPTIVTPATNCFVFRNFNASDEGFSSPSIYSGSDDVSFFWDATAGAEIETSGLTVRSGSLISPVYLQAAPGNVTLGFRYEAPAGCEYRIRIITGVISSPLEILATTANGPVYTLLPSTSGTICLSLTDGDLTLGRPVRFEFTFRLNQPGNVVFDDLSLSVAAGALPVTFEGFIARKNADESLQLLWNVGEEDNVKRYVVESSKDGLNFTTAGYVTATGKSIYSLAYPKLAQTTYFRIKNEDFDGRSKYSPVIKVYQKEQMNGQIQLYPMPATDMVTVQHKEAISKGTINLYNSNGKMLQQVIVIPHSFQTQISLDQLAKGMYLVSYYDGQSVSSAKLVKY